MTRILAKAMRIAGRTKRIAGPVKRKTRGEKRIARPVKRIVTRAKRIALQAERIARPAKRIATRVRRIGGRARRITARGRLVGRAANGAARDAIRFTCEAIRFGPAVTGVIRVGLRFTTEGFLLITAARRAYPRSMGFTRAKHVPAWRKLALETWSMPSSPAAYGVLDLDCEAALAWCARHARGERREGDAHAPRRQGGGGRHRVGARDQRASPRTGASCCARRWTSSSRWPSSTRSAKSGGRRRARDAPRREPRGGQGRACDEKSVVDVARELRERAQAIRARGPDATVKATKLMASLPGLCGRRPRASARFSRSTSGWNLIARRHPLRSVRLVHGHQRGRLRHRDGLGAAHPLRAHARLHHGGRDPHGAERRRRRDRPAQARVARRRLRPPGDGRVPRRA